MYPPYFLLFLFLTSTSAFVAPAHKLILVQQPLTVLNYHNGPLLKGNYTIILHFYGRFSPFQRAIISDFVQSLSFSTSSPSVSTWWATTSLGPTLLDSSYSHGKSITSLDLQTVASRGPHRNTIIVILTVPEVVISGFCNSRCGSHASEFVGKHSKTRFAYLWVVHPVPGQCAWPFHQPIYGPQTLSLIAPNGDVGVDRMIIGLVAIFAGAVTNPFGNGFYQGPATALLEAVSACTGIFGSGSYPGYPGKMLVDPTTGASYNAVGVNGRKYLLPAMWDPKTSHCATLV